MQTFDVLSPDESVSHSLFLEASAGTGKTFTIEHLVSRLLLGDDEKQVPLRIDQILVITFTRAVAGELRNRIRKTLEENYRALRGQSEPLPYIKVWMDGAIRQHKAKMRFERALRFYDEAKVFTMHSFCARSLAECSLEGELKSFSGQVDKQEVSPLEKLSWIRQLIVDYFDREKPPLVQMDALMRIYQYDLKKIAKAITPYAEKKLFYEAKNKVSISLEIQRFGYIEIDALRSDLHSLTHFFKGVCNRQGEVKNEVSLSIDAFSYYLTSEALDLENLNIYGVQIAKYFEFSARKKNFEKLSSDFASGEFIPWFLSKGHTLFLEVGDPDELFAKLIAHASYYVQKYLKEDGGWTPNLLIDDMLRKVMDPNFRNRLKESYFACIIDEFQDTDPAQWEIFSKLFLDAKRSIYLVGDPKQSIYSFRDSDILTYLRAKSKFPSKWVKCLQRNYRSDRKLVEGLNYLFSKERSPHLFKVTKDSFLPYLPLKSSVIKDPIGDDKSAIHIPFFTEEQTRSQQIPSEKTISDKLIPYLALEIQNLEKTGTVHLDDIALLVRDRFQAQKLQEGLRAYGIPCLTKRRQGFSLAKEGLRELLLALAEPSNHERFRQFWGGILIQGNKDDILEESSSWQKAYARFLFLVRGYPQRGIAWFVREILNHKWIEGCPPPSEKLLCQEDGEKLYQQCLQLAENLNGDDLYHDPIQLILFLDRMADLAWGEDERALVRQSHDEKAVNILTLHVSKGLEFPIVFALGVSSRTRAISNLCLSKDGDEEKIYLGNEALISQSREKEEAEKMRQLYVGLTRASRRLYLPIFVPQGNQLSPKLGQASPLELFLAQIDTEYTAFTSLYSRMNEELYAHFKKFLTESPKGAISYETCTELNFNEKRKAVEEKVHLKEPLHVRKLMPKELYFSYSQLANSHANLIDGAPHSLQAELKNPFTLPVGLQTGIILHEILENVNFNQNLQQFTAEDFSDLITPYLKGSQYEPWTDMLGRLFENCFHAKLKADDQSFTLADLKGDCIYQEMGFIFHQAKEEILLDTKLPKGLVLGALDLVALYQDKIYFFDWKSNYLGNSRESYSPVALRESYLKSQYDLQAKIYARVIDKYIACTHTHWEFGGAFYLYLRGMEKESENGVLYLSKEELL